MSQKRIDIFALPNFLIIYKVKISSCYDWPLTPRCVVMIYFSIKPEKLIWLECKVCA